MIPKNRKLWKMVNIHVTRHDNNQSIFFFTAQTIIYNFNVKKKKLEKKFYPEKEISQMENM